MVTQNKTENKAFYNALPLVAILRYAGGVTKEELSITADVIFEAGITLIEITLNTENALEHIETLAKRYGHRACLGAGTVLHPDDVLRVKNAGGEFIVSPHTNRHVIAATRSAGLISIPGALTATEVFTALDYGADIVKIFPSPVLGHHGLRALRAVLDTDVKLIPTGGVTIPHFTREAQTHELVFRNEDTTNNSLVSFFDAGVWAVGLLNTPNGLGSTVDEIKKNAPRAVQSAKAYLTKLGRL